MRHTVPRDLQQALDANDGLSSAHVEALRAVHGPNLIVESADPGWRDIMRDTARDPMIWFLIGTAGLFAVLGDYAESAVLASAMLPIVGMDAWLHRRTQASTASLAGRLATRTHAIRDGTRTELASAELVPGDLVVVSAPEYLPADGIILAGEALQVDASALTGESLPQRKLAFTGRAETLQRGIDDGHWGAAGTRLLTGALRMRVVYTGARTLYGEIARAARGERHARTPLQQAMAGLVNALVVAACVLCVVLALARYIQGHGFIDALLSAVTLAVAALPEEFPVVFTAFLGVGVLRLARRRALVRRAVVVENIGRVTAICSDKTGTLTEGKLRLQHVLPAEGIDESTLLAIAARASRTESGDPLDLAVLECGVPGDGARLATFPFNEQSRREVAVFSDDDGSYVAVVKGAPETIHTMLASAGGPAPDWLERAAALGASGHKVIACASRRLHDWPGGEPDRDFRFAGLLAFEDPVRPGVTAAVRRARNAGIRILMVTGDHPLTAQAIALDAGIGGPTPTVIDGTELEARLSRMGTSALDGVDAVARCLPMQKLDIVRNLQSRGEIVAVTGDGVNDVPALQGADIGIAMGERGTRPAREVAPIVLLDDNFDTLIGAIAEGRQLFENLKLSFAYLLIFHMPLVLTAAFVPLLGYPLLYLPIHIVWLELIIHPTALLVFQENAAHGELAPVDRVRGPRFFTRREWLEIGFCGAMLTTLVATAFVYSLGPDQDVNHARSMAMSTLIMAGSAATLGLAKYRNRAAWLAAAAAAASAACIITIEDIATRFHMQALHADDWMIATLAGLLVGSSAHLFHHRGTGRQESRRSTSGAAPS